MMFIVYTILAAALAVIVYFKTAFTYWKRKGIFQIEPRIPFGNFHGMLSGKSWPDIVLESYKKLKSKDVRHGGIYFFTQPGYIPMDLDIVKSIMVKDFDSFTDHGIYFNEKLEPLSAHLFNLEGTRWKTLRAKMSPTFTSGKMKMMYPIFLQCSNGLPDMINGYTDKDEPVDIKDVLARFTIDIIGNCAFGIECNSMKDHDSEFRRYGKMIFERDFPVMVAQIAVELFPISLINLLGTRSIKKEAHEFFINVVKKTVEYREQNRISRPDFIQLLIQLKNEGNVPGDENNSAQDTTLTMEELAAQCYVFFAAGFETSSTTMAFALFELANNPDIQETLRKEIFETLDKDKELSYESVMEMKYLDRVIQETLRKYPPVSGTVRRCTSRYKVPGADLVLEKGLRVYIFIYGIHTDPDYYPDPEKFDPDRFTEENKSKRPNFTWLPFGEGPRICIGARFGLLQTKVGIISILRNYKLSLNHKTKTPLATDSRSVVTSPKGGIWLDVHKLDI